MEPFTLTIDALGSAGDGIATHEGRRLFIAGALPGEVVRVGRVQQNAGHARAEVLEVLQPSTDLTQPPCRHFGRCGGCKLQHLQPAAYYAHKRQDVLTTLQEGGIPAPEAMELLNVPHSSRRRVEWQCWREGGHWRVGYHRYHSHQTVAAEECPILEPELEALMLRLPRGLDGLPLPLEPTSLQATLLDSGLDLILHLPAIPDGADWQPLAQELGVERLSLKAGPRIKTVFTHGTPALQLGDYTVAVPPDIFLQAARLGQQWLTQKIQTYLHHACDVADIFSGIGTYSFPLLNNARTLHAYEGEGRMTSALQATIAAHQLKGRLTAHKRDLFSQPLTWQELNAFDSVVINPPRAGAASQCKQLADSGIETIAYVSCNPERFVRDAKILLRGGYRLTDLTAIDQFIWSPHLELVACFQRT